MARALMVQGTGSGVGKSLIVCALCRLLKNEGFKVAPFKAQNMALNSFITKEGGEIGRAQALQAEASGIEPTVDMNPILLKTAGEQGSQVIVQGKVHATLPAREYYLLRDKLWPKVRESFVRLSSLYDLVIMEGAGSPAEINLLDVDVVNMAMARQARAPVLLIGDIDKGGVFASLYGTLRLLGRSQRYIRAFIINKFRGDLEILKPGLTMIETKTGRPVIGVLPYLHDLSLPEEDSLSLGQYRPAPVREEETVKVVVLRLPYLSNFTDFDPFLHERDVELIYSTNHADLMSADLIIIPGTKKTVFDLNYLRARKLDQTIYQARARGIPIVGICGGFQIMGERITDPFGVESEEKEARGLGLLPIESTFERVKITSQAEGMIAEPARFGLSEREGGIAGYEIHMGTSSGDLGLFQIKRLAPAYGGVYPDGAAAGASWGTYLHGIFENDAFRRAVINQAREKKGLKPLANGVSYQRIKEEALDRLALLFRRHVDMEFIRGLLRI